MEKSTAPPTPQEQSSNSSTSEDLIRRDDADVTYPTGLRLLAILIPLGMCTFLVALDNTIIATAIPEITDEFKALNDVGWYGSAYLFTLCAFQPFIGKLFTLLPIKTVYLSSLLIFEIGSAICGSAPNSTALIFGRAIAGLGAAGDFSGGLTILAHTVPLEKRPMVTGLLGASWGMACVAGPLIGGALTTKASWRWCFYINLPVGAVVLTVLFFAFQPPKTNLISQEKRTWKQSVMRVDPLGTITFLGAVICCLLALQWGGSKYSWNDGRIIALFILTGVLIIAFGIIEKKMGSDALVPLRVLNQRSILGSVFFNTCIGGIMYTFVYFLPIWFQAIKGVSAWKSGVMIIPLLLGLIVMSILAGMFVSTLGYYAPVMLFSSVLTSIGSGLLTTLNTTSGHPVWIGFQVLLGFGLGAGIQQPLVCAQTVLSLVDIPIGTSILMFVQSLGGSIFIAIANNVFLDRLQGGLTTVIASGDASATTLSVMSTGAVDLAKLGPTVQGVYNSALTRAWYVPVALAGLSILGAGAVEWRSVKKVAAEQKAAAATTTTTTATTVEVVGPAVVTKEVAAAVSATGEEKEAAM